MTSQPYEELRYSAVGTKTTGGRGVTVSTGQLCAEGVAGQEGWGEDDEEDDVWNQEVSVA